MQTHRFPTVLGGALAVLIFAGVAFVKAQAPATPQAPAAPQAPGTPPPAAAGRGAATPGTETGWATFQTQCAGCHGVVTPIGSAPTAAAIRAMTPERIYAALQGKAHQGRTLTDIQA